MIFPRRVDSKHNMNPLQSKWIGPQPYKILVLTKVPPPQIIHDERGSIDAMTPEPCIATCYVFFHRPVYVFAYSSSLLWALKHLAQPKGSPIKGDPRCNKGKVNSELKCRPPWMGPFMRHNPPPLSSSSRSQSPVTLPSNPPAPFSLKSQMFFPPPSLPSFLGPAPRYLGLWIDGLLFRNPVFYLVEPLHPFSPGRGAVFKIEWSFLCSSNAIWPIKIYLSQNKQPFRTQPQIENEDNTWSPRYNTAGHKNQQA